MKATTRGSESAGRASHTGLLAGLLAIAGWAGPLGAQSTVPQTPRPLTDGGGPRVLVVYYSASGFTRRLADAVVEGARSVGGAEVTLRSVDSVSVGELRAADGLILGSPTYYASMAAPMKRFIDDWALKDNLFLGDKVGGAFATGGGITGGKEQVVVQLLLAMLNNGMMVVGPWEQDGNARFGYFGASAVTGPEDPGLSEAELAVARRLGERVARVAGRLAVARQR